MELTTILNNYSQPITYFGIAYTLTKENNDRLGFIDKIIQERDLNRHLIGTYEIIRDRPYDLVKELEIIHENYNSLADLNEKADYYRLRERYNESDTAGIEKATLFIALNKTGYNGMYRENRNGGYNIPFGKHEKSLICDAENLRSVAKYSKY